MSTQTLTVQEAADYLRVSADTVYKMVRKKEIPHFRIRRRIMFTTEAIDGWRKEQESSSYELQAR